LRSHLRTPGSGSPKSGLTLIEVLIILALAAIVVCFLLMAFPRAREQARLAGCRRNLAQIGMALALYNQFQNHLPTVGQVGAVNGEAAATAAGSSAGPLGTLLESLAVPDFIGLTDAKSPPEPRPGEVPGERPVPGFVCESDPAGHGGRFPAPVSYRAATGDSPGGENGAFAPGRLITLAAIEAADGTGYTAGFSERLIGNDQNGLPGLASYQLVPDRVPPSGCPASADFSMWRGDAGRSWRVSDYRSTLYNHALPPQGQPSCIASDGQTASLGASSGHTRGVNVLMLDGSVSLVVPTIHSKVWREMAAIGPSAR
jgi:prepilin-type processing-associated H-X9-DG protein